MLKCLMKYEWVKLRRDTLPAGKGIMGAWAKLAARAAFRKGHASYCGHKNAVSPGMWSGGIVGLKSILGIRSRTQALEILDKLSALGYLKYTLDSKTKKLTYQLTDWVVKMLRRGMHERNRVCHRRFWVSLPPPQYYAATCRGAIYI